jgi:SM-20-related protein
MMLRLSELSDTPLIAEPYPYQIVPHVLSAHDLNDVIRDFPKLDMGGLFLPEALDYGPKFAQLLEELEGSAFRRALGGKFGVDLTNAPLLTTIRGCSRAKDGRIHADAKFKVISVLLYLNDSWSSGEEGRLRVLRSPDDIEDYVAEVPPDSGTLFSFQVTPNGWHGHKPFVGVRRNIMLNYCTDERLWERETKRHRMSGRVKNFKRLFGIGQVPGVTF